MFELFQFAAQSSGKSAEMNGLAQTVVFRAASLLILQLAVIGSAQQTVPLPASVPGSSASPGKMVAESSQSQAQAGADGSRNGAIPKPGNSRTYDPGRRSGSISFAARASFERGF